MSSMAPEVLWVEAFGAGTPLLLLHGLGMTGGAFRLMTPVLGKTFRLVVPDLRGHGRSAHLPGARTTEAMAADLLPTLDALGIGAVHVLGHSHGGAVAQALARAHPERVRSLLLVSTYPVQLLTWWQQMLGALAPPAVRRFGTRPAARVVRWLRSAGGGRKMSPKAAALCAAMVASNDSEVLADVLCWARQFDSRSWLGSLRVPTLVIQGDADYVVVPRQAQMLADGIPGARLQFLPRGGHALPLSHPVELADLVAAWLDERMHGEAEQGWQGPSPGEPLRQSRQDCRVCH